MMVTMPFNSFRRENSNSNSNPNKDDEDQDEDEDYDKRLRLYLFNLLRLVISGKMVVPQSIGCNNLEIVMNHKAITIIMKYYLKKLKLTTIRLRYRSRQLFGTFSSCETTIRNYQGTTLAD